MVTVIGSGGKNRIQVKRCDAQIAQIIHSLRNSIQIAAFETMECGRRIPGFKFQVWHPSAAREAVGKDLVEDCVLYPIWGSHFTTSRTIRRKKGGWWPALSIGVVYTGERDINE